MIHIHGFGNGAGNGKGVGSFEEDGDAGWLQNDEYFPGSWSRRESGDGSGYDHRMVSQSWTRGDGEWSGWVIGDNYGDG